MFKTIPDSLPLGSEQKQLIQSLEAELVEMRAQLKMLASKIALLEDQTGSERTILTRPEFNREVARMLAYDERYGGISSVIYFDIVSLNELSARVGQEQAAEALKIITQLLTHSVRRSDIVGRLATDEFGVLLVRCNNENAWKKGRELAAALITALNSVNGQKLPLDVCFGAYTFREDENVAVGLKEAAQSLTKVDNK